MDPVAFGLQELRGMQYNGDLHNLLKGAANDDEWLNKAFTTGSGVVAADATGGQALRMQFLHNMLETASYEEDAARGFKRMPREKVYSPTFEWSQFNQYGGAGDGFTGETGTDGSYGLAGGDDAFARRVGNIKFMYALRQSSVVAQATRNIENLNQVLEKGATLEIIGKAGMALYTGDSKKSTWQFDGLFRQIWDHVIANADDQAIMYDAGGNPLDEIVLNDIAAVCRTKFGNPSLLLQSIPGYGDTEKMLYPRERFDGGSAGNSGTDRSKFMSRFGVIQREYDVMLRPNLPVIPDGTGSTGHPRTTADTGAIAWSATPWTSCAAGAAGAGAWYSCVGLNTGNPAAAPAVPSGEGNQGNRLGAQTVYYAVSLVYAGKESLPWVYGLTTVSLAGVTTMTAVSPTAGQIVTLTLDNTSITGITTSNYNQFKVRIYRASSASTNPKDWGLLCEAGVRAATSTTISYDNGTFIPGYDNAVLVTEKYRGQNAWMMAQLLPIMKRTLPNLGMADQFAILAFMAPWLPVPKKHVWVRNIGPGPSP